MHAEWVEYQPSLRDEIISRAQLGEIKPDEAEAKALEHGLEPFEQTPEPPAFDPLKESRWSIVMAVSWIAWRDLELVREQNAEFRSQCKMWVPRQWNRPNNGTEFTLHDGWFLAPWPEPTTIRLELREVWMQKDKKLPSNACMSVGKAKTALWGALSERRLIAEALNGDGKPIDIPERELSYLKLFEAKNRDCSKVPYPRRPRRIHRRKAQA